MKHPVAVLNFQLNQTEGGWVQLLPAGHFASPDGRPADVPNGQWFIDEAIATRLIAQAAARANPMVIDYEHQTLHSETNGQKAPAAGWFQQMQWRDTGLYIKADFTAAAKSHIDADEYRFISAVFPYHKETGEVLAIRMAALTNDPGLHGLEAISKQAALKFSLSTDTTAGDDMNPLLLAILKALGITPNEGQTEPTEAQLTAANTQLTALKAKADSADGKDTEIAALKAGGAGVDLTQYVPKSAYDAVSTQLAALSADKGKDDLKAALDIAFGEGRFLAGEREYLEGFGQQQGVAALKAMLDKRAPLVALKQTQSKPPEDKQADDTLSEDEQAVLKHTGLTQEAFLKSKKELAQ